MNLSQLRYVKALAETRSFTLAAEQCYVTQPSLSNAIAQLEQEFEERLFTRTSRTVALTPFGERILPFIDKVLAAQADLLHETRKLVYPSRKVVHIGISPLLSTACLAPILAEFRKTYPDVEIILHEQNMADLYQMLDENLLDIVCGISDTHKSSWSGAFLYREPLYFIPRGMNYPEGASTVRFEDIAQETFIMVPNACGLARATRALFRSHRRKLNEYAGEVLSYHVLEDLAAWGLGAAILPRSKLSSECKARPLINNKGKALTLDFEALWLNDQQRPVPLQQFTDFLTRRAPLSHTGSLGNIK